MTLDQIRKLLAEGEGFTIEYKKCSNRIEQDAYETVCSFSNRYGGHLFLGVADDGTVLGVNKNSIADHKINFASQLNNAVCMLPTLYLSLEEFEIDGKWILYVYVPSTSFVQTLKGKIYDRNDEGDMDITRSTVLVAELYQRKSSEYSERKLFPFAKEEDLLFDKLMPIVRRLVLTRNPKHPWRDMSDMEIMRSAGLYEDDKVTGRKGFNLAGILLFGRDDVILSCTVNYVTDCILRRVNLDRYDDRLMVRTNMIESFDLIMGFIQKHTPDPFYLEGVQSISIRDAIARELVSNILAHRELNTAIPARIIIEKDRIYADNYNRSNLFGPLDPNTFSPKPKNPLIAQFFTNISYADQLGSGVRNLFKYTPIFSEGGEPQLIEGDMFQTIIPLPKSYVAALEAGQSDIKSDTDGTLNGTLNGTLKSDERRVLELLKYNPQIKREEIAVSISKSVRTVQRILDSLTEKGIVKRGGAKRATIWEIVKDDI